MALSKLGCRYTLTIINLLEGNRYQAMLWCCRGRSREPAVYIDRRSGSPVVDRVQGEAGVSPHSTEEYGWFLYAYNLVTVPHRPLKDTVDVGQKPLDVGRDYLTALGHRLALI